MPGQLSKIEPVPDGAVVDAVFVHGFNGCPEATWTQDDVFWPRDLLPKDFPKARIFTFQCSASSLNSQGDSLGDWVTQSAKELRQGLVLQQDEDNVDQRPLVFVAHSLGGLVCAEALLTDIKKKKFVDHVRKIAVFGTPLQKFEMVQWASLAEHLIWKSEELDNLGKDFAGLVTDRSGKGPRKLELHRFFEEEGVENAVVPEEATKVGDSAGDGIPCDHHNICRFKRDDAAYGKVSQLFQRWATEFEPTSQTTQGRTTMIFSGEFFASPAVGIAHPNSSIHAGRVKIRNFKPTVTAQGQSTTSSALSDGTGSDSTDE